MKSIRLYTFLVLLTIVLLVQFALIFQVQQSVKILDRRDQLQSTELGRAFLEATRVSEYSATAQAVIATADALAPERSTPTPDSSGLGR